MRLSVQRRQRQTRARHIRRAAGQRGQVATEYMLVISVLVIGVVAAAYSFSPTFKSSLNALLGDGSDRESQRNIPDQIDRGFVSENP